MKSRYFITAGMLMVCFYIVMPVYTLAASVPIASSIMRAEEIEEIVKKDISKLSPQIIQDSISGKIPHLKPSIVREIITYGLGGNIPNMTVEDMQMMIKDGISGLSPQIVQDILQGKFPSIDVSTVEEMISIALDGGIEGILPKDIQEMIHISIPNLSPSIVKDILQGKIPGIDIDIIEEMIQTGILGGIMGITAEKFQEMLKEYILFLPQKVIQDLVDGILKLAGISIDDIITWITGFGTSSLNVCFYIYEIIPVFCQKTSCDKVLKCVMKKQRETLNDRLDDLINTIKANTKQTKHQTKIIEQEVLAYRRLEARVKKEALSLKEARYLSNKIKNSVSIGSTIETSKKGQ